jgi:hypothetical protein
MKQEQKVGSDFQRHSELGQTRIDPQQPRQEESHRRAIFIDQNPPDLGVMGAASEGIAEMQAGHRRCQLAMDTGTTGERTAALGTRHLFLGWALMKSESSKTRSLKAVAAATATGISTMVRARITMAMLAEDLARRIIVPHYHQ